LISWVIENLVKNAVDAMKGEGNLTINLYYKNKNILIDVKDSGSGMTNAQIRNAFKPGYSTKKRGWGLGLSLAKRVINEYHNGDIKIAESEVGKGTTFRIVLKS
jgi:signal transduction histidine kinase